MDSSDLQPGLMNRLVSGIKDKTVRMAEERIRRAMQVQETPEEAILSFVESAVASSAQRLEVRVETNDLVLTHDGKMIHPTDAVALGRGTARLPELSAAVRLHLASQEGKLELQFLSPLGMHQASFSGKGEPSLSEVDLNDLKMAKMTTRIYLKGSGNYRRVNQAMGNELPEVALIRRRCFLAPLDLQISGKNIARFAHLPNSLVTAKGINVDPSLEIANVPSSPGQGLTVDFGSVCDQLCVVKSGLCGVSVSAADAGWYRLTQGVARPLAEIAWPNRTWGFVVVKDGVALENLAQDIQLLANQLTHHLYLMLSDGPSSSQAMSDDTLAFLEQQRPVLLSLGHQAISLDKTFLTLRQACSPSSDPRVLNSRLELASSLENQGQESEANQQYAEVLPIWESEALNHFDKYRFEEGAALWQKALMLHEKLGTESSSLAEKYLKLAEIGREQRLGFAEQSYRKALQLYQSLATPETSHELTTLLGLAEVLKKNRVLTESLRYAEQAHRKQLELNDGKETQALVPVLKLQAELHDLMGDYVRSTEFEQKALLLKFRR